MKNVSIVVVLLSISSCGEWELLRCGYGGPGCGLPVLEYVCSSDESISTEFLSDGTIFVGHTYLFQANYGDDSGYHTSEIDGYKNLTPEIADVTFQGGDSLYVDALVEGTLRLQLTIPGWEGQEYVFASVVRKDDSRNHLDSGYTEPGETEDGGKGNEADCSPVYVRPERN